MLGKFYPTNINSRLIVRNRYDTKHNMIMNIMNELSILNGDL